MLINLLRKNSPRTGRGSGHDQARFRRSSSLTNATGRNLRFFLLSWVWAVFQSPESPATMPGEVKLKHTTIGRLSRLGRAPCS